MGCRGIDPYLSTHVGVNQCWMGLSLYNSLLDHSSETLAVERVRDRENWTGTWYICVCASFVTAELLDYDCFCGFFHLLRYFDEEVTY